MNLSQSYHIEKNKEFPIISEFPDIPLSHCNRNCGGVRFQYNNHSKCYGPLRMSKNGKHTEGTCWKGPYIPLHWLIKCCPYVHVCKCNTLFIGSKIEEKCPDCLNREIHTCTVCGNRAMYIMKYTTAEYIIKDQRRYFATSDYICENEECKLNYKEACINLFQKNKDSKSGY